MAEGWEQMRPRCALFLTAPQGFAINGDAFDLLKNVGGWLASTCSAHWPSLFSNCVLIQVAEDRMQRTRTGSFPVRKAQGRH